ncbi:MAG: type II secretion system F family protein, partial [Fimbriimonadales bacterium]|nr:type II secretion system F family protein [Fimbriimonadales bacterium]
LWFWLPRIILINAVLFVPLLALSTAAFLLGLKLFSESPGSTPMGAIGKAWGLLLLRYGVPFWIFVLLLWILWHRLTRSPRTERWRSAFSLKIPYLWGYSDWIRFRSLQTFLQHLMHLTNAGIMPGTAWELSARAVPNRAIAEGLLQVKPGEGDSPEGVDSALARTGLFPPEEVVLLSTGVQTGDVVETLRRLSQMYEARCEHSARLYRLGVARFAILLFILATGIALIGYCGGYYGQVSRFAEEWVNSP